jgi:hypothetical protein
MTLMREEDDVTCCSTLLFIVRRPNFTCMTYPEQRGQNVDPSLSFQGQNPQNYSLFPALDGTVGRQVEHLEFHELMKNRIFQDLHQRWTVAASTMVKTSQANNSLLQENRELKAEIQRLKAGEGCLSYAHFIFVAF